MFQGRSLADSVAPPARLPEDPALVPGQGPDHPRIEVVDTIPIPDTSAQILLGQVEYTDGDPEIYVLPGSVATGDAAEQVKAKLSDVSVAQLHAEDGTRGVLYSAIWDPAFCNTLFSAIRTTAALSRTSRRTGRLPYARVSRRLGREPSGSRVRSLEGGTIQHLHRLRQPVHPEDLSPRRAWYPSGSGDRHVSHRKRNFPYSAPLTGVIEYRANNGDVITVASSHAFVQDQQGDAWHYTLDSLSQFFDAALARKESDFSGPDGSHHPFELRKVRSSRRTRMNRSAAISIRLICSASA